jgi:hypothetical protein
MLFQKLDRRQVCSFDYCCSHLLVYMVRKELAYIRGDYSLYSHIDFQDSWITK